MRACRPRTAAANGHLQDAVATISSRLPLTRAASGTPDGGRQAPAGRAAVRRECPARGVVESVQFLAQERVIAPRERLDGGARGEGMGRDRVAIDHPCVAVRPADVVFDQRRSRVEQRVLKPIEGDRLRRLQRPVFGTVAADVGLDVVPVVDEPRDVGRGGDRARALLAVRAHEPRAVRFLRVQRRLHRALPCEQLGIDALADLRGGR